MQKKGRTQEETEELWDTQEYKDRRRVLVVR